MSATAIATPAPSPIARPERRPDNPNFSSGPCAKRPGWSLQALADAPLGRSHRAAGAKARIADVIDLSRRILGLPEGWRLGVVPGSDTGAIEMAMWSLLGARGVDVLAFESFSEAWATDVVKQLKLPDARVLNAPYGQLPDLAAIDPARDVVFAWNGTTSGVRFTDADWIAGDREGLVLCDATSAAFACCSASRVCGITPSVAATTSTTMSVALAPRARISVKASWPGVSRNTMSPWPGAATL